MLWNCAYSAIRPFGYFNLLFPLWFRDIFLSFWLFFIIFGFSFISSWLFFIHISLFFFKSYWRFFSIIYSWVFSWGSPLGFFLIKLSIFSRLGLNLTLSLCVTLGHVLFYWWSWVSLFSISLFLVLTWDSLFHVYWSFFFIHGLPVLYSFDWIILIHDLIIKAIIEFSSCSISQAIFHVVINYFLNIPSQ